MDKHQKNKFIKDIKNGDSVKDIFAVVEKEPVKDYSSGQKYMFSMILKDKTGSIAVKVFGSSNKAEVEALYNSIIQGKIVFVEAIAKEYKGTMEFTVNPPQQTIRPLEPGSYEVEHFVQHTKKEITKLVQRLQELIENIEDDDLKGVMRHIFSEKRIGQFSTSSAAIKRHHAFVGGLLEHSISLAEILLTLQKMHPELNRDYLICGALIQDIGKLEEITGDVAFTFTPEGSLVGHLVLGAQIVAKASDELKTPREKALKLMHLVLSHHNELENGSPITPRFPEAAAVALADALDAKTQEFIEAFENWRNVTKEETVYDRNLGRYLYLK